MTETEYRNHLNWIKSRLPSTFESISEPSFLRSWFDDDFQHIDSDNAAEGLERVRKLDILPKSERFMLAWARESKRIRADKAARSESKAITKVDTSLRTTTYGVRLMNLLKRAEELPVEERHDFIESQFPDDEGSARSYFKCRKCRDTGYVNVWSEETMNLLLRGTEPDDVRWDSATAACECFAGGCITSKRDIGRLGDKDYFIECNHPDSKAKAIEVAGLYRSGMHRAIPEFNEWNTEEF